MVIIGKKHHHNHCVILTLTQKDTSCQGEDFSKILGSVYFDFAPLSPLFTRCVFMAAFMTDVNKYFWDKLCKRNMQ